MTRRRTPAEEQVAGLLRTAKDSLGLSTAFLSRLDGRLQHLEVVESDTPVLFPEKVVQLQSTSFCQRILDGELPPVMPDVTKVPGAMRTPAAWVPRVRSFVSVPVTLSDGTVYGTFCAAGLTSDPDLTPRDKALMDVLAQAASVIVEPEVRAAEKRDAVLERLRPVEKAGGPRVLLQPIVDLVTGNRVGAEALSRFPADWRLPPDVVFAQAHEVGKGDRLELLALRRAAAHLDDVSGYVSMNVSPATLLTPRLLRLLDGMPLHRVLLELSEHDPVEDYDALRAALAPLRRRGMRLAIDDVGAGFSSLRHIVVTEPDVIKLDRSIVDGVAGDGVLRSLVRSLVDFAAGLGAVVVAEGVERRVDADVLQELRVGYGQGWYWGRAVPSAELVDRPLAGDQPTARVPAQSAPVDARPLASA
ncbi:EAL domain-containing protein [Aquipuribacter nitratireducens]|uniref:EAL domain-containing protein n=1 Tax=Aquipuribacter nitratireducens TaxID=650104 RepID=A0ABW0GMC1_9MICO